MNSRLALVTALTLAVLIPFTAWPQPATPVGPKNPALHDGAQALMLGQTEYGIKLTLEGLSQAQSPREEETALTNLCTGYLRLRQFDSALKFCNMLLERNENAWRGYNSRAMVYLELKQYEKADQDLKRAEAINPGARTLQEARAQYLDAIQPVATEVEIDDRSGRGSTRRDP
jgi:tetratricopeptide (TPR) repeat protein